jgi:1,4-alpha-glucan branching enzyme
LHRRDCDPSGFRWIANDPDLSLTAFARFGDDGDAPCVVVCNYTPVERHWRIGVPAPGAWEEVLNTDSVAYGGGDRTNGSTIHSREGDWDGLPQSVEIRVPPLAALILRHQK